MLSDIVPFLINYFQLTNYYPEETIEEAVFVFYTVLFITEILASIVILVLTIYLLYKLSKELNL